MSSRRVIHAAIVQDLLIGATKFVAAGFAASSAMPSEGVHSIVDTANGLLLLYGLRRAAARPDHDHPVNEEAGGVGTGVRSIARTAILLE